MIPTTSPLTESEGVGNEFLGELVGRCVGDAFSLLGGWGERTTTGIYMLRHLKI